MIVLRNDEAEAYFREVEEFAKKTGQLEQFRKELWILHTFGETSDPRFEFHRNAKLDPVYCPGTEFSRAWLYKDLAPYSFNVSLEGRVENLGSQDRYEHWMDMGLIYHGPHDGYGSGSAPTFAVTIDATQGWSIHS